MSNWFATLTEKRALTLPEAYGLKALEVGSNSVYLRWAFLSHSLSNEQLNSLIFEFRTMDNALNSKCQFQKAPKHEYKVRLQGLSSNTRYRFQIRCKLKHEEEMIYSNWSNRIEFKTKRNYFSIIADEKQLDVASLKFQINELQQKCNELMMERDALNLKLKHYLPPHLEWGYKKIVEWMMRIENGVFVSYKDSLLQHLKDEDFHGKDLVAIDTNDLHRWGITKFHDKKIMLRHIHKLTENDKLPDYSYDPEIARTITTPQSLHERQLSRLFTEELAATESPPHNGDEKEPDLYHHYPSLPTQDTHFSLPATKDESSNESNHNIQSPLKLADTASKSYGLTKSVKNLLASSPENEPPKQWKYKNGVLSIKVIKATNVDNMDADEEASDPYVELELKGHYKKERTKVIYNDADPIWNERFQLFPENPKKDILKCKIWDKDTWTFDDKIGSVYIPVIDVLNANGYINKAFDIRGSKTGAKLYLELKYKELEH